MFRPGMGGFSHCRYRRLKMNSKGLKLAVVTAAMGMMTGAGLAQQTAVLPTGPHAANNTFPFNQVGMTFHQLYVSSLFTGLNGGDPVEIQRLAFSPSTSVTYEAHVAIRLGYTAAAPLGLLPPLQTGGGAPNASGPMHLFYDAVVQQQVTSGTEGFSLTFDGAPFEYDPNQGNLLVEIIVTNRVVGASMSRTAGGSESSRAWQTHGSTGGTDNSALRTQFTWVPAGPAGCYADCNQTSTLNVDDFICFINEFATAQGLPSSQQIGHYANCDGSTTEPILTVDDFVCFINEFATGCP
jgi:hypothetical protein